MKRLTKEDVLKKCKEIHGNKYDYSKLEWVNGRTKINIICPEHGEFKQRFNNHIYLKHGCPICAGRGKGDLKRFLNNAKRVHGDRYNYSEVKYVKNHEKVIIICPEHGEFKQTPTHHIHSGGGCSKCNGGVSKTQEDFIKRAKEVHGNKYDYSLVKYVNSNTKVKIICPEHGVFEMRPTNHTIKKQCCKKCSLISKTLTTEDFINKAKEVHGKRYDYSLVDYKHNNKKIKIKCPEHGVFLQKPTTHLTGRGCAECKIKSRGELIISEWLNENNVDYVVQKSFSDCKNILPLRYDFYLPEENMLIEYDGEPHFKSVKYLNGDEGLKQRQICDEIKTKYAENNNIRLLRIPYMEIKNISEILKNNLIDYVTI